MNKLCLSFALSALLSGCATTHSQREAGSVGLTRQPASSEWVEVVRFKGDGAKVTEVQQGAKIDKEAFINCEFRLKLTSKQSNEINEVLRSFGADADADAQYGSIRFVQKILTSGTQTASFPYTLGFHDGSLVRQTVTLDGSMENNMDSIRRMKILEMRCR